MWRKTVFFFFLRCQHRATKVAQPHSHTIPSGYPKIGTRCGVDKPLVKKVNLLNKGNSRRKGRGKRESLVKKKSNVVVFTEKKFTTAD